MEAALKKARTEDREYGNKAGSRGGHAGRMTQAQRRQQLIDVTLQLIRRLGIEGATTPRIAATAGVTEPTLYRYFDSRKDLLLAAFRQVHEAAMRDIHSTQAPDSLQRLRRIGEIHNARLRSNEEGYADPLWEFIAAPAGLGLRETVIAGSHENISALAAVVDEGKAQGVVRADVDAEQTAWRIMGFFFLEDVAWLLGAQKVVLQGLSMRSLQSILEEIEEKPIP